MLSSAEFTYEVYMSLYFVMTDESKGSSIPSRVISNMGW